MATTATKRAPRKTALPAQIRVAVGDGAVSFSADVAPAQVAATVRFLVESLEAAQRAHAALRGEVSHVDGGSVHVPEEDGWGYGREQVGFVRRPRA
jgi:hypothetical protein